MEFVGAREGVVRGEQLLEGRLNYFLGNDRSEWATDVARYSEVRSERLYDGVEARWYFDRGAPRYDLIVAPGVDPSRIQIRFTGAGGLTSTGDELKIVTSIGEAKMTGLLAYQMAGSARQEVPCAFRVEGNLVRFDIGAYDRARPLVIDPVIWSTYVGGAGSDGMSDLALDPSGNFVCVGLTQSSNFPSTVGSYDTVYNGYSDAYIFKMNPTGTALVYGTFLGAAGNVDDQALGVAVDGSGNAYVVGETTSGSFPVTVGAWKTTFGGAQEGFAAKLSANGSTLLASTFLGGTTADICSSIALDASSNPIIGGYTSSSDYPTTVGSLSPTQGGGWDSFITKLNPDLTSALYSTYLGGSGDDHLADLAVESTGRVVAVGSSSGGFPVTVGAFDTTSAYQDVFVARLNAAGSALIYATYLGGNNTDGASAVAIGPLNSAIVVGSTLAFDFPTTPGAFRTTLLNEEGFITQINSAGSSLIVSTLIGGSSVDALSEVAIDSEGYVITVGNTQSPDFPVDSGGDATYNGSRDVVVTKWYSDLSAPYSSTFHGGAGSEYGAAVVVDASNNAIVGGGTGSADFPTTPGAFQLVGSGGNDWFLTSLNMADPPDLADFTLSKNSVVGGFALRATVTLTGVAGVGGASVALTTNNANKITGPPAIVVPDGDTSKVFNIRTYTVLTETVCTVTATHGGVSVNRQVTLKVGGLQALKINPVSFVGGTQLTGQVIVSAPAPAGGRNVQLLSLSPNVQVPATVNIPQGQTSATFPITTSAVGAQENTRVDAKLGVVYKREFLTLTP